MYLWRWGPTPALVVILLLRACRERDALLARGLLAAATPGCSRFRAKIAAILAARNLLLCVQAFEHEINRRRDERPRRARLDAGTLGQLGEALDGPRFGYHIVRRRRIAERES